MIDAVAAAFSTVALITPALIEIGKGGANKFGETAAEKVLGWLRGKTIGRAQEALTDLEREPVSEDNQADFRKQLAKLLTDNPALLSELSALLPPEQVGAGDRLEQHIGAGGKEAQIKGSGNTTNIS
jgi:hypothetical protein